MKTKSKRKLRKWRRGKANIAGAERIGGERKQKLEENTKNERGKKKNRRKERLREENKRKIRTGETGGRKEGMRE